MSPLIARRGHRSLERRAHRATSSEETSMSVPTAPTPQTTVAAAVPPPRTEADLTAVRPFEVHVPEEQLADLRRRIAATRWPSRELVPDRSQGVQLATM